MRCSPTSDPHAGDARIACAWIRSRGLRWDACLALLTCSFPIGPGAAKVKLRGTKAIGFYAESRAFETYIPSKSIGVAQAFTAMMTEVDQDARQYADCMTSHSRVHRLGCKALLVRNVGFAGSRYIVHGGLSVARHVLGKALAVIVGSVEFLRWAYEQPQQVKQILHSGTISLGPATSGPSVPQATAFSRQSLVTATGAIAPGFTVTQTIASGDCHGGSEVGQAYRCVTTNPDYVLDPCYAIADPVTGDGTGVVCPTSPFSNDLNQITSATGLSVLQPDSFDEPNGIVLASGTHCTEAKERTAPTRQGGSSTTTATTTPPWCCAACTRAPRNGQPTSRKRAWLHIRGRGQRGDHSRRAAGA